MNKKTFALLVITMLAMLAVTVQATTVTIPDLKASPSNSHIFRVSGLDFNVSAPVTLQLSNGTHTIYTFTESVTTNDTGEFEAIVIAPTSMSGKYDLVATTYTVKDAYNATTTIKCTLPDFTGLQGPKGDKGDAGSQGEVGPAGPKGDSGASAEEVDYAGVYAGGAIAFIALIISVYAMFKKKP